MMVRGSYVVRVLFLIGIWSITACNSGSATAPGGLERAYTGEWIGATSQGTTITFSVSAPNIVTSITIGHSFNGCRDTQTFSGLSVGIGESGLPGRMPTPANPGFGFGSGSPEAPTFVQVAGQFTSSQAANGTVTFLNFQGCGNTVALWNATKR
jgi:hypothetical protein